MKRKSILSGSILISLILWAGSIIAAPSQKRTDLRPGFNMFTVEQDIEFGREISGKAEKELQLLQDPKVDAYLNRLTKELAQKAQGAKYPYEIKAVNDLSINAFALPGGFLYFNRGVIESAQSEAQLAGVIGHEIGHVALRHGTNQATKAAFAQGVLSTLGGVLGSNSIKGMATQLIGGGLANCILLQYSRSAENQADLAGTHILYDANYDPRAMIQFFEILEQKASHQSRMPQWLSTHPSTGNRMQNVANEIELMGGVPDHYRGDSRDFAEIQKYIRTLPPPKELPEKKEPGDPSARDHRGTSSGPPEPNAANGRLKPAPPAERTLRYENQGVQLRYPQNWKISESENSVTIAPPGSQLPDAQGNLSLAYGMILSSSSLSQPIRNQAQLEKSTSQIITRMQQGNPRMRVVKSGETLRAGQEKACSTWISNDSPIGGTERVWLITFSSAANLHALICVAPESDFESYLPAFQNVVDSIVLR